MVSVLVELETRLCVVLSVKNRIMGRQDKKTKIRKISQMKIPGLENDIFWSVTVQK